MLEVVVGVWEVGLGRISTCGMAVADLALFEMDTDLDNKIVIIAQISGKVRDCIYDVAHATCHRTQSQQFCV